MKRRKRNDRRIWQVVLVEDSPLRQADPRTRLALSFAASLAVMLPLERLIFAIALYALLLIWARLLSSAARQLWRLKIVLIGLFLIDWLVVGLDLAVVVTLRLALLAGAFALFFVTTTPGELRLALEWLGVPHRYAFSISLAFQSLDLLDQEWRSIREAQQSRGAWQPPTGWRTLSNNLRDLVALSVPAIVMTTKRAWAVTEAAYARGFDSPHRQPYQPLQLNLLDGALLISALTASLVFILWR